MPSTLINWPIELKLTPVKSDKFDNGHLLIAADCTAFTYKEFHQNFMQNRSLLIACPKLDGVDYTSKLTDIFMLNNIKSIALVRMQVPCCSKLELMIKNAILLSGKTIPLSVRVISTKGEIVQCY